MKNRILIIITFVLIAFSTISRASVVVLNGLTHTHALGMNSVTQGKIILKNQGAKPERVLIYQEDLTMDCNAGVNFSSELVNKNSLRPFLQTSVDERILQPDEEYVIFYDIDITKSNLETGTYWSIIMIEGAEPVREQEENNVKINSVIRYAVQVIGDVGVFKGPEIHYINVQFEGFEDSLETDQKVIKVRLENRGTFSARIALSLELYNSQGESIKTLAGENKRIYPGGCSEFQFAIEELSPMEYSGVIIADSGSDLFGANISFEIH